MYLHEDNFQSQLVMQDQILLYELVCLLLITIFVFTYQLCVISTVIYHMFLPYKCYIFAIKFSCIIDNLQPWKFKLWYFNPQVFWATLTFTVIDHIIFCIALSIVGCWKILFCSSWIKLGIQANSMCMEDCNKTTPTELWIFIKPSIVNSVLNFFLAHIEAVT